MQTAYPVFTEDMKKTHKILIPNMAPVQFRMLAAAMERSGYQVELLGNCGSQVSELGLKYTTTPVTRPYWLSGNSWTRSRRASTTSTTPR